MARRSPFPGMDPYLERHWLDVHLRLNYLTTEVLQPQLGGNLFARGEERVVVDSTDLDRPRQIGPDVRIVELTPDRVPAGGTTAVADRAISPLVFTLGHEPIRQRFIEIRDAEAGGRIVTVIEFTSPSNKVAGDGQRQYLRKLKECRDAGVNLIEVDLTRYGRRALLVDSWPAARSRRTTYAASIWRAGTPEDCVLYPIRLQDRLPTLPVPLRPGDADVTLDLQAIIDRAYESGAYGRTIDYARPPRPPLVGDNATWAAERIAAATA